jgi:hypothetical protein
VSAVTQLVIPAVQQYNTYLVREVVVLLCFKVKAVPRAWSRTLCNSYHTCLVVHRKPANECDIIIMDLREIVCKDVNWSKWYRMRYNEEPSSSMTRLERCTLWSKLTLQRCSSDDIIQVTVALMLLEVNTAPCIILAPV